MRPTSASLPGLGRLQPSTAGKQAKPANGQLARQLPGQLPEDDDASMAEIYGTEAAPEAAVTAAAGASSATSASSQRSGSHGHTAGPAADSSKQRSPEQLAQDIERFMEEADMFPPSPQSSAGGLPDMEATMSAEKAATHALQMHALHSRTPSPFPGEHQLSHHLLHGQQPAPAPPLPSSREPSPAPPMPPSRQPSPSIQQQSQRQAQRSGPLPNGAGQHHDASRRAADGGRAKEASRGTAPASTPPQQETGASGARLPHSLPAVKDSQAPATQQNGEASTAGADMLTPSQLVW